MHVFSSTLSRLSTVLSSYATYSRRTDWHLLQWCLQVDSPDFSRVDGRNSLYPEKDENLPEDQEKDAVDFSAAYLRVEHQTLNRLPKTKAVIFCVRSVIPDFSGRRQEGGGRAFASGGYQEHA